MSTVDDDALDGLSNVVKCAMDNGCTDVLCFIREKYGDRLRAYLQNRMKEIKVLEETLPPSIEAEDSGDD